MLTTLALVNTSSYAAALGRAGMLETVGGLIRLQFWKFMAEQRFGAVFDVTTFYKKNPGTYTKDLLVLNDHLVAG